jgi:simple sugar transport system permease protein
MILRAAGIAGRVMLAAVAVSAAAVIVVAVIVAVLGGNPGKAVAAIWQGAVGSGSGPVNTLLKATPLLLCGLSIATAFRCGLWNIGAEGQLLSGMLGATAASLALPPCSPWVGVPVCLAAASLSGAVWAALPAYLKLKRGVSEVISTIMLNFLIVYLIQYLVRGPMRDPNSISDWSAPIPEGCRLPRLMKLGFLPKGSELGYLHVGVLLAVAAAGLTWLWLSRSSLGFRWRVVGLNPEAAATAGIPVPRALAGAFLVSGALAGLGGGIEQLAVVARLYPYEPGRPGYGFSGIAVALLGQLHPLGVLTAAVFLGGLAAGCDKMQRDAGISLQVAYVIQAVLVLLLLALPRLRVGVLGSARNSPERGDAFHDESSPAG